jgi:tryptophan-rich sensory protein
MKTWLALPGWIGLTFGAALTGMFIQPAGYYAALSKPWWSPPAWVFGPAWTILYTLMAIAAWLVWCRGGWSTQRIPLSLYLLQLVLNALWTPLFFGLRNPGLACVEIILLWLAVALTLRAFFPASRAAGCLLVPYWLWVTFAAALNFSIWRLQG